MSFVRTGLEILPRKSPQQRENVKKYKIDVHGSDCKVLYYNGFSPLGTVHWATVHLFAIVGTR